MCDCASCSYTDSFRDKGFAEWPRGEPAGQKASERAYTAHVRHSFFGARKRTELPEFYNVPAGMTRAQVQEVLNRTFAPVVEKPTSLLDYARKLRQQAKAERQRTRLAA